MPVVKRVGAASLAARWLSCGVALALMSGSASCTAQGPPVAVESVAADEPFRLNALRSSLRTRLFLPVDDTRPAAPPAGELEVVRYPARHGDQVAYLSPIPQDGTLHPAVVWVTGGLDWGIGPWAWEPAPAENDQSARQFRHAGVVTMYPAPRGSNGNDGRCEFMLGEPLDYIAAGQWLAQQPGVDPSRVYLAGHSTGGTMALLVAASTDFFRAIFALGPVARLTDYGIDGDAQLDPELHARSPLFWLDDIQTPTYAIEGAVDGNGDSLTLMDAQTDNPAVTFTVIPQYDHFSVIVPALNTIAAAILADTGPAPAIRISLPPPPVKP